MTTAPSRSRGFALPLVLVVLSIVALAVASVGYAIEASAAEAGRIVGDLRGRAACDSMVNIAAAVVQERLRDEPSSTPSELVQAVCNEAGACTTNAADRRVPGGIAPEGVVLEDFFVGFVDSGVPIGIRPIPSGGFTKLLAEERLLGVYVRGRDIRSGRECNAEEDLTLASLSPLQFDLFVEPRASLSVTGSLTVPRLHRNDDLPLSNVTVTQPTSRFDARLGTGVTPPAMQSPNTDEKTSMRFIVDPAIATDNGDLTSRRLAHLSDIRIIDGVWYVRMDNVPWPGTPVWSDHPGANVVHKQAAAAIVQSSAKIGQADIRALHPGNPTRFSHYETNANGALTDTDGGVISYGTMLPTLEGPVPAVWPSFPDSVSTTDICGGTGGFRAVEGCPGRQRALLEATRSGFEHGGDNILPMNFDIEAFAKALADRTAGELGSYFPLPAADGTGGRAFNGIIWITQTWKGADGGLVVPGASTTQLPTQGTNNDGASLGPVRMCAPAEPGVASNNEGHQGAPVPAPTNGAPPTGTPPITQPVPCPATPGSNVVARAQNSVPMTVCGGHIASGATASTTGTGPGQFQIAACSSTSLWGSAGGEGSVPNALRLVRGRLIDAVDFPVGLTIATNLPMYVQGDINSGTLGSEDVARRKVLLAADRVTLLSAQFSDDTRPWNTSRPAKIAGSSTIVASFITGIPHNANADQAFRSAESWRNGYAIIKGSVVIGFFSVFDKDTKSTVGFGSGLKLVNDTHLTNPLVQPPGVPRVLAGVTGRWRR